VTDQCVTTILTETKRPASRHVTVAGNSHRAVSRSASCDRTHREVGSVPGCNHESLRTSRGRGDGPMPV